MFSLPIILAFTFEVCYSAPLPTELDWRSKGAILPVSVENGCYNSALINGLDAISAMHKINGGNLTALSAQQIFDCSSDRCPCDPLYEHVSNIYQQIFSEGHSNQLDSAQSYPYTGLCTKKCMFTQAGVVASVNGFVESDDLNQEKYLYDLLQSGPVIVEINSKVSSFETYASGVYDDPACTGDVIDQHVLLVGYGTDQSNNYWIVRNSWGSSWGEKGYIRIVRDKNMCGIGNGFVQPILVGSI